MGVRDRLERVAAWFGFGVDEDDYYEEEEEGRSYTKERRTGDRYADDVPDEEPGPTVRRLGRSERSSAFGTSLGDLFGSEAGSGRERSHGAQGGSQAHLRAVPDRGMPPARVSVVDPSSFNDAQARDPEPPAG
jgi:cell division inhibitor SepF